MLSKMLRAASFSGLDIEYIGTTAFTSNGLLTLTFSDIDIGIASSDRLVVCCIHGVSVTSSCRVTGATIGGTSATEIVGFDITSTSHLAVFSTVVSSGATATIVVNTTTGINGRIIDGGLSVYTIKKYNSSTPIGATRTAETATSRTMSETTESGGGIIAFATTGSAPTTLTFSGVTADYSQKIGGDTIVASGNATATLAGSTSVTFTANASTALVTALASWK